MSYLPCVEIETAPNPDASVIWLHGLGADGHDFEPVVPELGLPAGSAVRFIFPHAPAIPVTINGGVVMPAWYDITAIDIDRTLDERQLRASADRIGDLIEREIERGVSSERIIIAGFSQGGAVAYQVALSYPKPLAAVIGLSTYFATANSIEVSEANRQLPVFVGHGSYDAVVPEFLGKQAVNSLKAMGFSPVYQAWPMDHSVCLEEVQAVGAFIKQRLGLRSL